MSIRPVKNIVSATPHVEGAGDTIDTSTGDTSPARRRDKDTT